MSMCGLGRAQRENSEDFCSLSVCVCMHACLHADCVCVCACVRACWMHGCMYLCVHCVCVCMCVCERERDGGQG